jgi:hypothetical protein
MAAALQPPPPLPNVSLLDGERAFVRYDEDGEPWHERFILSRMPGTHNDYIVLTPDHDVYVETLECPPLRDVRKAPAGSALPAGLGRGHGEPVYKFVRPPNRGVLQVARNEEVTARREAILADPDRYDADAALAMLAPGLVWICVSPGLSVQLGEKIEADEVARSKAILGDDALVQLPDGVIAVRRIALENADAVIESLRAQWVATTPRGPPRASLPPPSEAPPPESPAPAGIQFSDARVLPVARDSNNVRYRSIRNTAEITAEVPFDDWPLLGPRTSMWYVRELGKLSVDPIARHSTWKHENGLKDDQRVCTSHEMLAEILELAVCVDQLDVSNLSCFEILLRHTQMIEAEVKKSAESKKEYDVSEYYLGRTRRTGGALVCPDLVKWVAERAGADSNILKEQRKAAEERRLAKK